MLKEFKVFKVCRKERIKPSHKQY